jgi:hypothetical protein
MINYNVGLAKYWVINHDADLTETGYCMRRTYVKSEQEIFSDGTRHCK